MSDEKIKMGSSDILENSNITDFMFSSDNITDLSP